MKVQGKTEDTQLRHALMQLRGAYMENVRAGTAEMDKDVLKDFDKQVEVHCGGRKSIPAKR